MKTTPNDGGLAFPHDEFDGNGQCRQNFGMSLRDYFAAKAMQGILGQLTENGSSAPSTGQVSQWAYEFADAMLAARNSQPTNPNK